MPGCRSAGAAAGKRFLALTLTVAFLATVAIPMLAPPAEAASVTNAAFLPSKRLGSAAVHVGDGITYVFGGRVSKTEFLDEIVRFDAKTGDADVLDARIPSPTGAERGRYQMAAAFDGDKIYIFGGAALYKLTIEGQETLVPQSVSDILEFDPDTESIRRLTTTMPEGRWGAAAQALNGVIYIAGGLTFEVAPAMKFERHDTILRFEASDGATGGDIVKLKTTLPFEIQDAASAVAANRIWLFGGLGENNTRHECPWVTSGGVTYQRTLCTTVKITWFDASIANGGMPQYARVELPEGIKFASAAALKGSIYVMGGSTEANHGSSKIYKFDAIKEEIETLVPTLPGGRWGFPSIAYGENVYMLGGRDGQAYQNGMRDITKLNTGATEPWAPRDLSVTSPKLSDGVAPTVDLQWEPPLYDGGAAVEKYRVLRIDANGAEKIVGEVSGKLSLTDSTVKAGAEYTYRVVAVNAKGESPTGAESTVTVGKRPPTAPRGFQAFAGDAKVVLRWAEPEDDGGEPVKEYRVYRSNPDRPFVSLAPGEIERSGTFFTFVDDAVTNGEQYEYWVRAANQEGQGPATAKVLVTPLEVPDAPATVDAAKEGDTVRVEWDVVASGGASGYHLYKGTEPYNLVKVTDAPVTEATFTDAGVKQGLTYYYAVSAVNGNGEGPWSGLAKVSLFEAPSAPLNLLVTEKPGAVELMWTPPQDLGGADADAVTYLVLRDGRPIANDVEGTKFVDRRVQPGTTYEYAVKAFNGLTSPESTPKSGTPKEFSRIPPVAALTAVGSTHAELAEDVEFDASLSSDEDGRVVEWIFDFGDGTPQVKSDSPIVTHAFTDELTFVVKAWAVDDMGLKSEEPARVTIDVGDGGVEGPARRATADDLANASGDATAQGERPGTKSGGFPIPAPGAFLALAAVGAALALAGRRREG